METAVGAIAPLYRVVWPTEVGLAYVHTFPTLTKTQAFAKKLKAFNKLASKLPTLDTARVFLREFIHGNDVYSSWKAPPAFYILERFLGAKAVASAILERFAELDAKKWAQTKNYDHARIALGALGYLLLRMDEPARTQVLRARDELLRKRPKIDRLTQHLRYLPDRPIELSMDEYSSDAGPWFMDGLTVSPEPRWKDLEPYGAGYVSVRALYLEGPDGINDADLSLLLDGISKASMLEEIDTFGRIKHPSSVRRILAFGRFKSMVNEVRAWKEAHAEYVDAVLPMSVSDSFVQKGLQGLDPNAKPIKKAKDP